MWLITHSDIASKMQHGCILSYRFGLCDESICLLVQVECSVMYAACAHYMMPIKTSETLFHIYIYSCRIISRYDSEVIKGSKTNLFKTPWCLFATHLFHLYLSLFKCIWTSLRDWQILFVYIRDIPFKYVRAITSSRNSLHFTPDKPNASIISGLLHHVGKFTALCWSLMHVSVQ